ncbi:MAG: acyl-CoA dehydrogenase family protein [Deinococcus sp.]|nr:acyl-CoA dehydrogenase family protein [Deinococcus sp.]
MRLALTDEQRLIQASVRQFAQEHLRPIAAELDASGRFPQETLRLMGPLGLLGMTVPEHWGGAGTDLVSLALAIMEVSKACASHGTIMAVQNALPTQALLHDGTDFQREHYLRPLAQGRSLGAFSLSEPGSGSDAASMQSRAERVPGGYRLFGTKAWVTSGGEADVYLTMVMTNPSAGSGGITAFLLKREWPGISFGPPIEKLGIRAAVTTLMYLDGVFVPGENRVGEEGAGFKLALRHLNAGRIGIAAQAVGIAQAALEASITYAKQRQQFGQPIGEFQAIQFMLADMATTLEAAELLMLHAAWLKDQGQDYIAAASQAKVFASEAAESITSQAIQIHGGYGYCREFPVERHYRDARVTSIYEGTSEIQRIVIAREILKQR